MDQEQSSAAKNTVTIEQTGPCRRKVTVEIPEDTVKTATDKQYDTLRRETIVPGFRKGRAPRRLLEKRFGKEATEQVKLKLLAESSEAAIKDNNLDVLGDPDIDYEKIDLPLGGPLKFDFEVEVRPEFDLPQLEGIPVTRTKLEVTDEQTEHEIEQLRKWHGIWMPKEDGRVAAEDRIVADAVLTPEQAEAEKLDNIEIHVRQNGFVGAVPVEKLDELLADAKCGDVRQTTVDVPKTYFREDFRGKKVDVRITVKDIKSLKPADLDENFFNRYQVADEKDLREKLHDVLHGRLEQQLRSEMTDQIYKYLVDNTQFDLPVETVADYSNTLLQRQYSSLLMRGLTRQQLDEQMEHLRASSEERAKEQLKVFFIMDKVGEKLGIEVTDEEINGYIAEAALRRGVRPERMKEEMVRDNSLAQFKLQVRQDKCISRLLEQAVVAEVEPKKAAKKAAKTTRKQTRQTASTEKKQPKKKKTTKAKED